MIVTGEGRQIPYTNKFLWPISQVISVFEVKKTLYTKDLDDAFGKLRVVKHMADIHARRLDSINAEVTFQAFAKTTGHYPNSVKDVNNLPQELSQIFRTILDEQLAPVRVILGYHGFADEQRLREGLFGYLQGHGTAAGFGASSMPNLIVASASAILKMDGHPYVAPLSDGWWPLLVSNSENPLRLLIELLWTKLGDRFGGIFPGDDDLTVERLAPFVDTRLEREGDRLGWIYVYHPLSKKDLAAAKTPSWRPEAVESHEIAVLLALAELGSIDVRDNQFRNMAKAEGIDPDALVADLVNRRIIAWIDEYHIRLTDSCTALTGFTPNGHGFSTTDTDRFGPWLEQELDKHK